MPPESAEAEKGSSPSTCRARREWRIARLAIRQKKVLDDLAFNANPLPSQELAANDFKDSNAGVDRTEAHGMAEGRPNKILKSLPAALNRERAFELRFVFSFSLRRVSRYHRQPTIGSSSFNFDSSNYEIDSEYDVDEGGGGINASPHRYQ